MSVHRVRVDNSVVEHLGNACHKGSEYVSKQKVYVVNDNTKGRWILSSDDYARVARLAKTRVQSKAWNVSTQFRRYKVNQHRFFQLVLCDAATKVPVFVLYSRSLRWQRAFVSWLE